MCSRFFISFLQSTLAIMVAAVITSAVAMAFVVAITEVNHQMNVATNGSVLDLIVAILLTLLNVVAAGADSLLIGAKTGLYAGAAISLAYLLLSLAISNRVVAGLWRLALFLILTEAGFVGAALAAGDLGTSYILGFGAGAALLAIVVGLLLLPRQPHRTFQVGRAGAPAEAIVASQAHLSHMTRVSLLVVLVAGAMAIGLTMFAPLALLSRAATSMTSDVGATVVITPDNVSTMRELAHIDAQEVMHALFLPDGTQLAVATAAGVTLYDVATLTPQRTIESGPSRRIALSADGVHLATITGNNAQVWQLDDGTLLHTLAGHTARVQDVAFSPDGTLMATAALDRSVRLWRVSSGDLIYTLSHIGHVYSLDFRTDGQVLATGSDMGITLWQPTSGLRLRITDVILAIANDVAFSRDGIRLAAAMSTGDVGLREGNNYSISRNLQRQQAITTLAFSPDGELLAFGGIDQSLHLWQVTDNVVLATLNGHQGTISSVAFSPDGRLLITAALDGTVRLWGTEDTLPEDTLPEDISTEEIGTQGTSVMVASATPLTADVPSVSTAVNVATPTSIPTVTPTTESASRVRVTIGVPASQPDSPLKAPTKVPTSTSTATNPPTPSPTATRTAMPTPTHTPTQMPVQPGVIVASVVGDLAVRREMSVGSAADMAYTADGRRLAVAAVGRILILDGQTLAQLNEIETQATTLAFSPDGESLATAWGTVASLWRVADGELLNQFELHSSAIMDIAFSPDGTTLATASVDQMARLWRISDATLLHQFSHFGSVHSLAFSPDGALLATGTTVGAVQWRVSDGGRLRVLTLNPNRANRLVFSPDGQNLAAATENGNIWVWRAAGAGERLVLQGHTNAATDVAFSPDSQLLASASADGTLRLWRTSDGAALRALSGNTGALINVTFHPDGATLMTATADGTLQAWDRPAPVATPTAQTSTRLTERTAASPLRMVTIEPVEVAVVASDWQIAGAGSRFAEVTRCGDGLLWHTPDLLYEGRGIWSFDGQHWELHFADDIVVVACEPGGAPYALVIPQVSLSEEEPTDNPPVTVYRREDEQWREVVTWSYGYKVWQGALFSDLAVDRNGGIWLPSLLGDGNADVISALLRFDAGNWHIYVGADENRLDDPLTRVGGTLKNLRNLQIYKTLPPGYEQPTTFPQGAELLLPQWMSDVDLAADGTVWISRPFLWPERFDGQRWQSVVEPQLVAHISATLDELGIIPPEDALSLAEYGVLDGNGAPWLGVRGGVLHSEQGRWMLYHLPADEHRYGPLIPLAMGADGSTWFWQSDTLLRYDGNIWQRFIGDKDFQQIIGSPYSYQPGTFLDATVGPDGALWIGGFRFLPGGTPLSLPSELAQ